MKIGDIEVPDQALEDVLKKSGKRLVDEKDYISKSEAAGDLAKFRAVTGESRSVDDLAKILKAHDETVKAEADKANKNKSEADLLRLEVEKVGKELIRIKKEADDAKFEVRKNTVNKFFDALMEETKVRVIEPILDEFRKPFYTLDESAISQEDLVAKASLAITKASERQKAELARLGLGSAVAPTEENVPFGGLVVTPAKGEKINDVYELLRRTSTSPMMSPFMAQIQSQQKTKT
jgi:hypothetical protein